MNAGAGKWRRRKDARADELLNAALELFAERGCGATRLEDVAARAGVVKGTIYRYFRNRRELLTAAAHERLQLLAAGIEPAASADCASGDYLRQVMKAWWQQICDARAYGLIALLKLEGDACHQQTIERYRATTAAILKRGVAGGEFRPVDIASMAQLLITPVLALLTQPPPAGADGAAWAPPVYPEVFLDLMLRGLVTTA